MAGQTLKGTLYQAGPDGLVHTFGAGTSRGDLPKWVKVDDGAFDGEPEETPAEKPSARRAAKAPDGSLPPKSGVGSGTEHWLAYARTEANAAVLATAEVVIPDDASREDIIAALEQVGVATERPSS